MKQAIARKIARENHVDQRTRFGDRVIDHVERVASAVPADARVTALLHDLLELRPTVRRRLLGQGLSRVELKALELLTHAPAEPYESYVRRIVDTPGSAGTLARIVKLADLDDHLAHVQIPPDAPPYAWARQQLLTGHQRDADTAPNDSGQRHRRLSRRSHTYLELRQ